MPGLLAAKNRQFMWGVASSSYQVEGDIYNNDWNFFTSCESIKKRLYNMSKPSVFYNGNMDRINLVNAGDACKFWKKEYYIHDFELARSLGMNAFKISLEWARIEPKRNEWNR